MSMHSEITATFSLAPRCILVPFLKVEEDSTDTSNDDMTESLRRSSRAPSQTLSAEGEQFGSTSSSTPIMSTESPDSVVGWGTFPEAAVMHTERLDNAERPSSSSPTHTSLSYSLELPSSAKLLNRVKEAKRIGRPLHELVHELQNEFYPLNPPPGYTAPPIRLYRATVARLERWNEIVQEQNSMEPEQISAAPTFREATTKRAEGSRPSSFWDYLGVSVSSCVGKRRKREQEVEQDDDAEVGYNRLEAGSRPIPGIASRKRRRANVH
ncbi:hypothetical protein BT96DRAFT_980451 [Gymnopus androsaceus JB14]|uniref:Uncharacterized protein n=1 Tax=Gymnopus androsaceus JB14 TaxID=1447944 RepID=A0A6A4GW45_9AGAR|nr:hypothetical protein BT96DRAFT_980451 [Gymnopus androsaceus JB14]